MEVVGDAPADGRTRGGLRAAPPRRARRRPTDRGWTTYGLAGAGGPEARRARAGSAQPVSRAGASRGIRGRTGRRLRRAVTGSGAVRAAARTPITGRDSSAARCLAQRAAFEARA